MRMHCQTDTEEIFFNLYKAHFSYIFPINLKKMSGIDFLRKNLYYFDLRKKKQKL